MGTVAKQTIINNCQILRAIEFRSHSHPAVHCKACCAGGNSDIHHHQRRLCAHIDFHGSVEVIHHKSESEHLKKIDSRALGVL